MTQIRPDRGQIWHISLDPTVGDEMGKTRPCIVVSRGAIGRLDLKLVVPLTAWKPRFSRYPWVVRLNPDPDNSLAKSSAADTFQLRSVSVMRFRSHIGTVSDERMLRIAAAIAACVA